MFYKVSPFGYFSRVTKVSQGPWFEEGKVEEDGLEYFYMFDQAGNVNYILSNNIPLEDREKLQGMFYTLRRNKFLAWFGGAWLGVETMLRVPCFRRMAIGWRVVSAFGCAFVYKTMFTAYNSMTYGPIVSAFLRKY